MYTVRWIMVCLLSLAIAIPCHAATFEKVSSTFSLVRSGHLQCSPSNPPGGVDVNFRETINDFNTNYALWGVTPILKEKLAYLISLDSAENAETGRYYDGPAGGDAYAMDDGVPYYNRVRTAAFHRPVFTFWQPGWYEPHTYDIDLNVNTEATAYYSISPLAGESVGTEVILTVEGWTEHTENWTGPGAFSNAINYLTNIPSRPRFSINPSNGGAWHAIDGTASFTARIGDIIGMTTSVNSSVGPLAGTIPSAPARQSYMPCGLFVSSSINVTMAPKLPGDLNGDGITDLNDAILALQVVSGGNPDGIRSAAGGDINGDNKIGLEEVIYIIQKMADLRPNEQAPAANY